MKNNKLGIIACSLFLSAGALVAVAALPTNSDSFSNEVLSSLRTRADAEYSLTLNSENKYSSGSNQTISTDKRNGATVQFAYTNASASKNGHVVLNNGGTLKNVEQLTSLSYFVPSFTLGNGASLKFRASNDGSNWGEYASIKNITTETVKSFSIPYMRYVEFKAEGGSVDINNITYVYTCNSSDSLGNTDYECGTSVVDENIDNYTNEDTYNNLINGVKVYTKYNGGATSELETSRYSITVKNSSNVEVSKDSKLSAGNYTATITRNDVAFADVSYNFTVNASKFVVTTDLTETKTIHTTEQAAFLAFDGDYSTLTANDMKKGTSNLSDPDSVALAWNFTPDSGKTVSKYSVTFGQNPDLSGAYEQMGTSSKSINLRNVFLGKNYFKINAYYTDNTVVSSTIKSFDVDETAPRNLYVGTGMTNCRDMGGKATTSGGKIKQGLVYRTCGTKFSSNSTSYNITDEGKTIMLDQLGVKTEIYLAEIDNYALKLTGTTLYNTYMDYQENSNTKSHFSRNTESLKNVFKILDNEDNYPLFYHCKIGTDRTGLVSIMLSGLLGVPLNMIYQDYLFSNFGHIGSQRVIGNGGSDDIAFYMQDILAMTGDTFQEKCYNTLLSIGVPKETLDHIIDFLTIDDIPDNDQGQIIFNVEDDEHIEINGGTLTHAERTQLTDRSHPEYYATLGNGTSVSFGFTTEEAGSARIYGYLGHTERSTSKTLATSVKVEIDGNQVSVPTTTFYDAGFGITSRNRMNYYFVDLGQYSNLAAGEHSITITGLANNLNLGTLSIFGVPGEISKLPEVYPTSISFEESEGKVKISNTKQLNVVYTPSNANAGKDVTYISSNTGVATVSSTGLVTGVSGGTATITAISTYNPSITATYTVTVPTVTHSISQHSWGAETTYSTSGVTVKKSTCSCGDTKLSFGATSYTSKSGNLSSVPSGYFKLSSNGNSATYTFTLPAGASGTLYFDAIMDSWSSNGSQGFYVNNNYNFTITVNSTNLDLSSLRNVKYNQLWSTSESQKISNKTYSKNANIEIAPISLKNGSNTIVFTRNGSYNPIIRNFIIVY